MANFYHRFIRKFSTKVFLITNCMKKGDLIWTEAAGRTFEWIKELMMQASVMRLNDYYKPFKVSCDTSRVGMRWNTQSTIKRSILWSKQSHPTSYWANSSFLHHTKGVDKKVVNNLSRKVHHLNVVTAKVIDLAKIKDDYAELDESPLPTLGDYSTPQGLKPKTNLSKPNSKPKYFQPITCKKFRSLRLP